ncbi:MAG: hypothetical protein COC19_04455 [SAR86 cluster bacterium]|uniref:Uncharacterized protein n=1 Tax=SAR86 cluster bacterium TaxID=2030880 RepID=A0A2A4MNQ5_9GAMM|nr:MAG: hypothetical protein COC19_04455 [SAR86 cluster bacterium]
MRTVFPNSLITVVLFFLTPSLFAQNQQSVDLSELQLELDQFVSVLEETLDLRPATGLFGINTGGINSAYLHSQGVLLTVKSPLAASRNRVGLTSLSSAMRNMQTRSNPFTSVQRPLVTPSTETMALSLRQDEVGEFYRNIMEKISAMDMSAAINSAIEQANRSARSLRSINFVDEEDYLTLREEMTEMRESLRLRLKDLKDFEQDLSVRDWQNELSSGDIKVELQQKLDNLLARVEPLREQAVEKAVELRQTYELASREYVQNWRKQVESFESQLYSNLCGLGVELSNLPVDEHLTVVLTGLGVESGDNQRSDKIHVINNSDLLQCQAGHIDARALQQISVAYSY